MKTLIYKEFKHEDFSLNLINKIILYLAILSGIILAVCQLFYNTSLWLDEAMLAGNIISRNFIGLLYPLDLYQIAPIGFLYVEKIFTLIFGSNEISLRLFPLICYIISIPLFYKVSLKLTNNSVIAILSTSFLTLTPVLFYYATEVKQYYMDVLACLIFLDAFLNYDHNNRKSLIYYGLTGLLAIWFSNASIIIIFVCGSYSIINDFLRNKSIKTIFPISLWVVSFGIYYFFFVYKHPNLDHQHEYFSESYRFWTLNPFDKEFYLFFGRTAKILFGKIIPFGRVWILSILLIIIGIIVLIKEKKYQLLYLLIVPLAIHFVFSSFKLYPVHTRLLLYYTPLLIIIFIFSIYNIYIYLNKKSKLFHQILLMVPIFYLAYLMVLKFPIKKEELNKSIATMRKNIKSTEKVYVYYKSIPAFEFYQKTRSDTITNTIIYGTKHRDDYSAYDAELLALKDTTWILFSHIWKGVEGKDTPEDGYMLGVLKENNYKIDFKKEFKGSSVCKIISP